MHLYNDKKKLLFDSCILSQSIWSHKNKAAPCNRLIMNLGPSFPLTLQSCFHNEAFGILAQNLLPTIKFWAWFNMKIWGHRGFWRLPIWSCNFLPASCRKKRGCDSLLLLSFSCSREKRNGHVTGLCIHSLHFPFLSSLLLVIVITDWDNTCWHF